MKNEHKQCCPKCKALQGSPQDSEVAKHYEMLVLHLPCLKSESVRKKCARKEELIAAAKWMIEMLEKPLTEGE